MNVVCIVSMAFEQTRTVAMCAHAESNLGVAQINNASCLASMVSRQVFIIIIIVGVIVTFLFILSVCRWMLRGVSSVVVKTRVL